MPVLFWRRLLRFEDFAASAFCLLPYRAECLTFSHQLTGSSSTFTSGSGFAFFAKTASRSLSPRISSVSGAASCSSESSSSAVTSSAESEPSCGSRLPVAACFSSCSGSRSCSGCRSFCGVSIFRDASFLGRDSEADRRQCRLIDRARIGLLQKQRLLRLFETGPLEDDYAVRPAVGLEAFPIQPVGEHGKLVRGGPFLLHLSAQLHLRRKQRDRVRRRIHDTEQHDHCAAAIDDFADPGFQVVVVLHRSGVLPVQLGQRGLLLPFQQFIEMRVWVSVRMERGEADAA